VFPVPAPIASVEARVTESAIELTWPVPAATAVGELVTTISSYKIYRSETHPAEAGALRRIFYRASWKLIPRCLLHLKTNTFRDASMVFDHTYVYLVRSVIQVRRQTNWNRLTLSQ